MDGSDPQSHWWRIMNLPRGRRIVAKGRST
jgi:hypothetical protein